MTNGFVSGVLASLLALGSVVCGQVAPSNASTPEGVIQSAGTPAGQQFTWTGDLDARRVSLVDGRVSGDSSGAADAIPVEIAQGVTKGFLVVKSRTKDDRADTGTIYQIAMLGAPTGYWIKAQITGSSTTTRAACFVFKGDPEQGGKIADPSPFTCSAKKTHATPDFRFTFDLALNRYSEASGTIKVEGGVSLSRGTYGKSLPYSVHGDAEVPQLGSTSFSTVLRDGDVPEHADEARTEWAYQISEGGRPTQYWAAGVSANLRGGIFYSEGHCDIYDVNPLANEGKLGQHHPVSLSPYGCSTSGAFVHGDHEDGNGHYDATFTVSRKATLVTDPARQKDLMDRFCADKSTCKFDMTSVTDTIGAERTVTAEVTNPSGSPSSILIPFSAAERYAFTNGFSGSNGKMSDWLSANYSSGMNRAGKAGSEAITSKKDVEIVIPPKSTAWLVGTPALVHTVSTIIVRDGDRYYELADVTADFPVKDQEWNLTTHTRVGTLK